MGKIQTFLHLLKNDRRGIKKAIFSNLTHLGAFKHLSDERYLKLTFRVHMGKKLDLEHPKTYNEKLQWLKLNDRNPLYTKYVDKYSVREYVAEKIGENYLIPLLGVWNRPEEIEFEKLPEKFVLKCNHDSGSVMIIHDKSKIDVEKINRHFRKALSKNLYDWCREWPYKNVRPRIIAEQYMEDSKLRELRDYKFFCFDGKVRASFIAGDRQTKGKETTFDFFDQDFNHIDVTNGHPNATSCPEKPCHYELMISLAEKLSEGIPHVRVDFYEADGRVYFGEMTFSHWSGLVPFEPDSFDKELGKWIKLPQKEDSGRTAK